MNPKDFLVKKRNHPLNSPKTLHSIRSIGVGIFDP